MFKEKSPFDGFLSPVLERMTLMSNGEITVQPSKANICTKVALASVDRQKGSDRQLIRRR